VPTDGEWRTLTTYLGGEGVAGGKMKEAGLVHWKSPNEGATNGTGFAGLPGGFRHFVEGGFGAIGSFGYYWSSNILSWPQDSFGLLLNYDNDNVNRYVWNKATGMSVRCLRD
jgi:uncharacterized protein (TIGR02145 family)